MANCAVERLIAAYLFKKVNALQKLLLIDGAGEDIQNKQSFPKQTLKLFAKHQRSRST